MFFLSVNEHTMSQHPLLSAISTYCLPWPLATALALSTTPAPPPSAPPPAVRYAEPPILESPAAHLALTASAAWKLLFTAAAYHAPPAWGGMPAAAAAAALSAPWVAGVALRNTALTWLVGLVWDFAHLHPASPWHAALQPLKFKPQAPPPRQVLHDACFATLSALVAAGWEVGLLCAWGRGRLALAAVPGDAWWAHWPTLALLLAVPYFQIVHFFLVHRLMHAWGTAPLDPGAWLYRHVHALHHKSRDPTAFSGTSMHPVESALFFSTVGLAAWAGAHPILMLHATVYNIMTAMLGHESYGAPSTGGHSHWLHHQLVTCNYGGNFIPLDWLCGSYVKDEAHFEQLREAKRKTA